MQNSGRPSMALIDLHPRCEVVVSEQTNWLWGDGAGVGVGVGGVVSALALKKRLFGDEPHGLYSASPEIKVHYALHHVKTR